jgi:hypothetical protein
LGVGSGGGVEEKERGEGFGRVAASGFPFSLNPTEYDKQNFFARIS